LRVRKIEIDKMGIPIAQEWAQACFEVGQVGVETTEAIDHREEVTVDNPLDHFDLCRSFPGTPLY
jgi:hypothetical protein